MSPSATAQSRASFQFAPAFPQPPCPSAQSTHPDPDLEREMIAVSSVNALIDRHARLHPDHCAIDMPSIAQAASRLRLTYAALREHTRGLARALARAGVRANDRVALIAHGQAHAECVLTYLALMRLGAVMAPINPRLTDAEIAQALALARVDGIVAQACFAARLDARADAAHARVKITLDAPSATPAWRQWDTLFASPDAASTDDFPAVPADALANILFTSGTTGRPKGVMHTHATALATGAIFSRALGLTHADVFHSAIPFFTSSGAQFTLMAALWAGATLITEPVFDTAQILQRMQERSTSVYLGVPAHLLFLIDAIERQPGLELPSLRLWDYGGAAMPHDAIMRLRARFPNVDQRQNYGLTETGPTGALMMPDDFTTHPGAIGRPMPLCELRITLPGGANAPIGEIGEIGVRSPANTVGYFDDVQATQKTLDGRWVHTGDLGKLDADGFLYYVDRLKDVINRGGLKIGSVEVEDALHRIPEVLEAAVVATPHPKLGEDLVAFVALREGEVLDTDALRMALSNTLADYKVPRNIRIVNALPRNPMGKVLKTALRELALRNS